MTDLVANLFLLVGSNIFIMPAIILAIVRGFYIESVFFSTTMIMSILYHFCQVTDICIFDLYVHTKCDYVFVYSTLIWIVLLLTNKPLSLRICFFNISLTLAVPMILKHGDSLVLPIIVSITLALYVVMAFLLVQRRLPRYKFRYVIAFLALFLFSIGLFGVGSSYGNITYSWSHALWHCTAMISLIFVIEYVYTCKERYYTSNMGSTCVVCRGSTKVRPTTTYTGRNSVSNIK